MAAYTEDIFKEIEDSINLTFNEFVAAANTRREELLAKLKKLKLDYLEKERTRLEQLQDLEKLIEQLDGTQIKHKLSQCLQSDFVSNAKREKNKFLQPTLVDIQGFDNEHFEMFKKFLKRFGRILSVTYIDKIAPRQSFGRKGVKPGQLSVPMGIAFSINRIFVVDMMNHRIQVFNLNGSFENKFGWKELEKPHGIAIYDDEFAFITDTGKNVLHRFIFGLEIFLYIGATEEGLLDTPLGVAAYEGAAYVADSKNNRIAVFSTCSLTFIEEIGIGQLNSPRDVTVSNSKVYAIDYSVPFHVHVFQLDGTYLNSIISLKGGTGTLFMCIDDSNNILINDGAGSCMQIFNEKGLLIHCIDIKSPGGIALSDDGDVICARKYDKEQIAIY